MHRIYLSLAVILGSAALIGVGGTGAFFSDTETSTGNIFTAGAIDLKVDNESYYNGAVSPGTSWLSTDLTIEKFFNFDDLKPDDWGEDTISLKVDTNDAYLCADLTLTSNNDNTQTEPEALVDLNGITSGELANLVNFLWWADDGDNVLETNENVISQGPIGALALNVPFEVLIADSTNNIWTGNPGPVIGGQTYYIGKAWCMGTLAAAPLPQGPYPNPGTDNIGDNGVTPEDGGITCDGTLLGNESQTDSLTADVSFEAVQARHNPGFRCEPGVPCEPSVSNIFVNGGFEDPEVTSGDKWDVFPAAVTGWTIAWRGDVPTLYQSVNRPEPGNLELHEGVLGVAHGGDQYAELDSDWNGHVGSLNNEPASTVISQTIPTIVGASYSIDYYFAPRPNTAAADNKVEAHWNGELLDTAGPLAGGGGNLVLGSWLHRGPFVFVATSTSAVVSFTDAGTANSLGSFIDDVTVLQTVCPA